MTGNAVDPTVSVVLTVYNGLPYVRTAVESVLNQTYDDFELVVVDDGSTDGTGEILEEYDDDRIRLHRQSNRGRASSLVRGVDLVEGEYVAIIDADDIAAPRRLERQVEALDSDPTLGLVGAAYLRRFEGGERTRYRPVDPPSTHDEIERELPSRNPFAHSVVTCRREAIRDAEGYDASLTSCIDYDLWVRIAATDWRMAILDDYLGVIRKHEDRSFRLDPAERVEYLATAFRVRARAARAVDGPPSRYLAPFVMTAWALVPRRAKPYLRP